jgi:hypothetical protein
MVSVTDGVSPLYGTCVILTPLHNRSACTWGNMSAVVLRRQRSSDERVLVASGRLRACWSELKPAPCFKVALLLARGL